MALRAVVLHHSDFGENIDLVAGMHRLRHKIFKERLQWDVSVVDNMEIDTFDAALPKYLLIVTDRREVVGHVRFLPTIGPTMLAETFPQLLGDRAAPRDARIVESSRFCVDTTTIGPTAANGLRHATHMLFALIVEWGLDNGQHSIVTVTDTRMERILRRAGWPLERMADAVTIGPTEAVAGFLQVSPSIHGRLLEAAGRTCRVTEPVHSLPLAA
jgi:acyl homoserine lactone synthase